MVDPSALTRRSHVRMRAKAEPVWLVSMRIKHGYVSRLFSKSNWTAFVTCNTRCGGVSVVTTAHLPIIAFEMSCALPTKNGQIGGLHRYSIAMDTCATTMPNSKMWRYREPRHVLWNRIAEDHRIWISHRSAMGRPAVQRVVRVKGSLPTWQIAVDDRVGRLWELDVISWEGLHIQQGIVRVRTHKLHRRGRMRHGNDRMCRPKYRFIAIAWIISSCPPTMLDKWTRVIESCKMLIKRRLLSQNHLLLVVIWRCTISYPELSLKSYDS